MKILYYFLLFLLAIRIIVCQEEDINEAPIEENNTIIQDQELETQEIKEQETIHQDSAAGNNPLSENQTYNYNYYQQPNSQIEKKTVKPNLIKLLSIIVLICTISFIIFVCCTLFCLDNNKKEEDQLPIYNTEPPKKSVKVKELNSAELAYQREILNKKFLETKEEAKTLKKKIYACDQGLDSKRRGLDLDPKIADFTVLKTPIIKPQKVAIKL